MNHQLQTTLVKEERRETKPSNQSSDEASQEGAIPRIQKTVTTKMFSRLKKKKKLISDVYRTYATIASCDTVKESV